LRSGFYALTLLIRGACAMHTGCASPHPAIAVAKSTATIGVQAARAAFRVISSAPSATIPAPT